jgi:hypothetical protein
MKKLDDLTNFELNVICHTLNFKEIFLDDDKRDVFIAKIKDIFNDDDIILVKASASNIILVSDFLRKKGYEIKLNWSRLRVFVEGKGHGYYFFNGDISEEQKEWMQKDGLYIEAHEGGFCAFYQ